MPDYELRSRVISSGLVKKVKASKKRIFNAHSTEEYLYHTYEALFDECEDREAYSEAVRVAAADFRRNTRLKNTIQAYIGMGTCIFLTITFTDKCLEKTSAKYRRHQVTDYLKKYARYYVANVDFGAKNGREHYHAIARTDYVDYTDWKHGSVNGRKIIVSSNPLKLAKYISKLVNHAIKDTCKRNAIIYSRVPFEDKYKLIDEDSGYKFAEDARHYQINPLLFPTWPRRPLILIRATSYAFFDTPVGRAYLTRYGGANV